MWAIHSIAGLLDTLLSEAERRRADRFHFAQDRGAFVTTRTALRHLLAAYTGMEPAALTFSEGPRGKPVLDAGTVHFNVSHSGGLSLLAFARVELGIDIERIRPVAEMDSIVERDFAAGEREQWRDIPGERRERSFFLGWTRKEAYIKALGEGLHHSLQNFEVSLKPDAEAKFLNLPGWSLYDLALPGYAAALAIREGRYEVKAWRLNGDLLQQSFAHRPSLL